MKTFVLAALAGLSLAAPATDNVRRSGDIGHNVKNSPFVQARQYYYPSGTGTAPAIPIPTGQPFRSCPVDGALVCGPDGTTFGLCNFGRVVFQPVAAGTLCVDGEITYASAYGPGSESCEVDGELVCGPDGTTFGLCNFGRVSFQPVAEGTECVDGEIGYADATPTRTSETMETVYNRGSVQFKHG